LLLEGKLFFAHERFLDSSQARLATAASTLLVQTVVDVDASLRNVNPKCETFSYYKKDFLRNFVITLIP